MNWKHSFFRYLAIYVAVSMCTLTPLAGIGRAEAAIGVKTLLVGGLVGGAALLALGAFTGPAGVVGSVAAAGTGFSTLMGGAIGGLAGGTAGSMANFGTLGTVALALGGMFLGAHFLGPLMAGISPWILVPAALVGGGLLVWSWLNRRRTVGTAYDQRFSSPFDDPLFNAQSRLANRSGTGYYGDTQSSGFLDRFRSIVDRNRRDDQFWWDQRYVDANGYVRNNPDFWGKLDTFLNGRNSSLGYNDPAAYGIGYGNTQYLDPYGGVRTDQAGRVTIGGTSTVQTVSRTGLSPSAPVSEKAQDGVDVEKAIAEAEARRKAAYQKLVDTIKRKRSQTSEETPEVGKPGPGLSDPEVLDAIREYREADCEIKELKKRLQPREKQ